MGAEMSLPVDYQAVLADLRAKREQIDKAIVAIEQLMLGQGGNVAGGGNASDQSSSELRPDSFFGMSITDAAKKLLGMRKRALATQEIADALDKGGLPHTSENWGNTVGSVLMRSDKAGGDIVRVKRGTWGLSAWYPNRRRVNEKNKSEAGESEDAEGDQ